MSDRLEIDFAEPAGDRCGFALAGGGLLVAADGRVTGAPAPAIAEHGEGAVTVAAAGVCEISLEPAAPATPLGAAGAIWLCRAGGSLMGEPFDGFGTIIRARRDARAQTRSLSLRLDSGLAVVLGAQRPPRAAGHGLEQLDVVTFRGEPPIGVATLRPRLSTTYAGDGRIVHCGLELWESEDSEFAERIGGEATAHGELESPDGARTRVAFLACHADGHRGGGRYAITQPVT